MANNTLIFAHRGANREAAENTQAAFDKALRYPIDGIETDVQLSRNGINVLWHDDTLTKLGLPDKGIADFDLAQLQAFNLSPYFVPGSTSQSMMGLRDFLERYRHRCRLLMEIKHLEPLLTPRQKTNVRQTLQQIQAGYCESIVASSFHLPSLEYAHDIAPKFPLIYNLEPEQKLNEARQVLATHPYLFGLCVHVSTMDQAMVELLHGQGKLLAVYTCNSERDIRNALALGVDVLITDVPQRALQLRDQ
jgi:glycerophosphoryl diester phosphodiesterase